MSNPDKGVTVTVTPKGLVWGITVDGIDIGRRVRLDSIVLTAVGDDLPTVQLAMEPDRIVVADMPGPKNT